MSVVLTTLHDTVSKSSLMQAAISSHSLQVDSSILHALKGVSFEVPVHGTVALVGESGSGKSVSALAILGLLPESNAMVLEGSRINYRGRDMLTLTRHEITALRGAEISMVFQEPMSSLNPVFTVG